MEELRKYSYCSMNICLAAVEVLVFVLCLATGDRLYALGQCGTRLVIEQREYWRLVTSVFLHAGISHLGSNLFVQILMGGAVERNIGHVKYLLLFLCAGIGGNIVSVLYDSIQGVNTNSVGASGAIFGVMGALVVLIMKGVKRDDAEPRQGGSPSMLYRAAFAVFYAVYSGFKNPYTDNAAHLGGLAVGVLIGFALTAGMEHIDLRDLR